MKVDYVGEIDSSQEENNAEMDYAFVCNSDSDNESLNNAFIEDPDVLEVPDVETTQFETLVEEITNEMSKDFSSVITNNKLCIFQLYTHGASSIKYSVELKSDFSCDILVHRKPVPKTYEIWDGLPTVFDRASAVLQVCERLRQYKVCCGSNEEEFADLVPVGACLSSNDQPGVLAYREGDFGAYDYTSTIRSVNCDLLVTQQRCKGCTEYRKTLRKRKYRKLEKESSKRQFIHTTFKHADMSRQNLIQKLNEQKGEINSLQHQVWKLRREFDNHISKKGVEMKAHESAELCDLMSCCSMEFQSAFPDSNSRQRIFWEQQMLHTKKKDGRGMRWHPMIIRWCLYIRQKSAKAYDAMRDMGFIQLPSCRTLFDYSHYIKSELGFQHDVFQMAKEEASKKGLYDAKWRTHVGILFDEIKVREDLVYDKHSGELIGYCNLGNVGNQMMDLENAIRDKPKEVAKYILVVMLRSLCSNWCFPLCAFATTSITADFLYPIIWRTVSAVEVQLQLSVLFWTCDGASPNRRFFALHSTGNDFVFKTPNPYEPSRNIYFISDVPHLLKTTRNNMSNSYSHKNSRKLWRNGRDISWMHIVRLFEEQCEVSMYNPCPKLTRNHVDLVSYNYMKVNLAAEVLSDTVANALEEFCGDEVVETVKFIRHVNKFFDCLNVRSLTEGRNKRNENLLPYRDVDDGRLLYLEGEFLNYFDEWRTEIENRDGNFTKAQKATMLLSHQTLTGLKITVKSICSCVKYLLNEGAEYVLTHSFNQDPLEQHFGHYRHKGGANNNPSVYDVRNTMTTLRTVHAQALPSKRGNTFGGMNNNTHVDNSALPRRKSVR